MQTIKTTECFKKYNKIFKQRLCFAAILLIVFMMAVSTNLFELQIKNAEHYATLADENRLRLLAVEPPRGIIYDRNRRPIAVNQAVYQLEIVPALTDNIEKTLAELDALVGLDPATVKKFRQTVQNSPPSRNLVLKRKLSDSELARFSAEQYRFPGVEITVALGRHYPDGELFAHTVGYIGRIDGKDLNSIDKKEYRASQYIGKAGVERRYEKLLHGKIGLRSIEINAQGRIIRVINEKGAHPGHDLMLTLDYDLQKAAHQALGDHLGSVVALDPRNGEILAMISKPAYDPNGFFNGLDHAAYKKVVANPHHPLFNRAIKGQYPPGSTIKPMIALAGLEHRTVSPDVYLYAGPYYVTPSFTRRFYDWREEGHGLVNLHTSIVQSCDVFFYDLAYRTGIDRISAMLKKFGLGQTTKVDLDYEAAGLVPNRAWKKKRLRYNWLPEETVITGVGQGYMLTTPLQLALVTAMIANQGYPLQPRLLKASRKTINHEWSEKKPLIGQRIEIQERHWNLINDAMMDTVHSPNGTAYKIGQDAPYLMAGKTGTAQVFSRKQGEKRQKEEDQVKKSLRDHALFIVYAPVENPSIAMAVVVENVGSGSRYAAPIARQVLDVWYSAQTAKTSDQLTDL